MKTIEFLKIISAYFYRCSEGNEDFAYYDEHEALEYLKERNEASGEEFTFEEDFGVTAPKSNEYLVYVVTAGGASKAFLVGEDGYTTLKEIIEYMTSDEYTLEPNGEVVKA